MLMRAPGPKLYTRLAQSETDVARAQRLRHEVFYTERGRAETEDGRDSDRFDAVSDHLLVFRQWNGVPSQEDELVGTYRLLRQDVAERHHGFYTAQEFEIDPLLARKKELRFLELGRSCVLSDCRGMPVISLLWQGIWDYVRAHRIDVMIGCASLDGIDPKPHANVMNFLAQHVMAPADWGVHVRAEHGIPLRQEGAPEVNIRHAMRAMPPLVRGYVGLGCRVADGAYVDHDFGTIDLLIVLPVADINPRYFAHFGQP